MAATAVPTPIRIEEPPVLSSVFAYGSETQVPNLDICRLSYYLKCCTMGCGMLHFLPAVQPTATAASSPLIDYQRAHRLPVEQQQLIIKIAFQDFPLVTLLNRVIILDDQHLLLPQGTLNTFYEFATAAGYFNIFPYTAPQAGHRYDLVKVMLCTTRWIQEYYLNPFLRYMHGELLVETYAVRIYPEVDDRSILSFEAAGAVMDASTIGGDGGVDEGDDEALDGRDDNEDQGSILASMNGEMEALDEERSRSDIIRNADSGIGIAATTPSSSSSLPSRLLTSSNNARGRISHSDAMQQDSSDDDCDDDDDSSSCNDGEGDYATSTSTAPATPVIDDHTAMSCEIVETENRTRTQRQLRTPTATSSCREHQDQRQRHRQRHHQRHHEGPESHPQHPPSLSAVDGNSEDEVGDGRHSSHHPSTGEAHRAVNDRDRPIIHPDNGSNSHGQGEENSVYEANSDDASTIGTIAFEAGMGAQAEPSAIEAITTTGNANSGNNDNVLPRPVAQSSQTDAISTSIAEATNALSPLSLLQLQLQLQLPLGVGSIAPPRHGLASLNSTTELVLHQQLLQNALLQSQIANVVGGIAFGAAASTTHDAATNATPQGLIPTHCRAIHSGVRCDTCFQQEIIGPRYSCRVCRGFDQCETCYHSTHHDQTHAFECIKYEGSPPEVLSPRIIRLHPWKRKCKTDDARRAKRRRRLHHKRRPSSSSLSSAASCNSMSTTNSNYLSEVPLAKVIALPQISANGMSDMQHDGIQHAVATLIQG